jgi:predicted dinucleotide-binding enzyme
MKIGIVGAGHIGSNAARLFIKAGHEVGISNSRGPDTLTELADEIGATPLTVEQAVDFGEIVFVSVPFGKYSSLPTADFIVLDNGSTTSSELLAEHLAGARVVKAFNTIWFEHLRTQGDLSKPVETRRVIFLSGDDPEAKKTVSKLIEEIGFAPYDLGTLAAGGRRQQTDSPIYNQTVNIEEARRILELSGQAAGSGN